MKTAKNSFNVLALFASCMLSTLTIHPAAQELCIPAPLQSVFPVITRGAMYIAERVNINIDDCIILYDHCSAMSGHSPREAFIETCKRAMITKATIKIYPSIEALLIELGHIPATTDLDDTVETQLKKLITHIDYIRDIIELLPERVRFSCRAFCSKPNALRELGAAKEDIQAYLQNPEEFIKNKKIKEEELLALAKLDFF